MDIFEFAMQMEQDGEKYYRDLAKKSTDTGISKILNMLADDEVKHYNILLEMHKKHEPTMADTEVLKNAKNVFALMAEQKGLGQTLDGTVTQVDLYRKAQELEKKSEDFYREKAELVQNGSNKKLMLKIAEEEKRHYFLLDNIVDFVTKPDTWLENAEWNHLEAY